MRIVNLVFGVFFFFKQKTAYEMRISDWSSDVCSSDLRDLHFPRHLARGGAEGVGGLHQLGRHATDAEVGEPDDRRQREDDSGDDAEHHADAEQIGRASCWERVCQYV